MATKREVERKLRELIERLDGADGAVHGSLAEALPEGRVVEVTIPDLDAKYWTKLVDGRMGTLRRGPAARADIGIRVDGDDLVDLVDGRRPFMAAVLGGTVKIDASLADMLRLRKLA